jgi:hypothetical protein
MPHKIEVTRAPALNSSLNFSFKGLQAAGQASNLTAIKEQHEV